jgi:pyruvate dehydrogenase E1 component alpha subunit/2-oxoisovalerate dehydrogenase E1 component alpha subunit
MSQAYPQTVAETANQTNPSDRFADAYRWMILARFFEEKIAALYRAGKIVGGVYLGRGQEAFSASLAMMLDREKGDVYGPLIRDQAGRLAFGEPLIDGARTYLGSVEGPMRGRDGNIHRGRPARGAVAMISHLGASMPVINGMLMAKRLRGKSGFVGGVCIGDGGCSTGAFHEAVNQAAIEKLPVVIAVANNQFAYSTPVERQFACKDLVDRAVGYGIRGISIDGTDLRTCLDTFADAVERARSGQGPQMIVGKLLRLAGHGEHDDARYIPPSLKDQPCGGDCVELARTRILAAGNDSEAEIALWEAETRQRVDEAVARAQSEPHPNPYQEPWYALSTKHLIEGISNVE